jgi:N-acetylmuramoyl-L-alanine amidase
MCFNLFNIFKKEEPQQEQPVVEQPQEPQTEENVLSSPEEEKVEYNQNMVMLLDNGHAKSTPGKRSPVWEDGYQFFEYEFNRDVVARIASKLDELGIKHEIITPEVEVDIKLSERVKRVNAFCKKYGKSNCFLISVHANASGNGDWMKARGWSAYTTKGATTSDKYATILYEEAERVLPRFDMKIRKDWSDGDPDYEENFTIINSTYCPAVLTENLFMDNKEDCAFLRSDWGREIIARIHVEAIKRIFEVK